MTPKTGTVPIWTSVIQIAAIMLIALVAGSTFGIWRGYNPSSYAAATFIEVHQGSVRGLNFLLPAMAFAAIGCILILAYGARRSRPALFLYLAALAFIVIGGLATRLVNQPINVEIMHWTAISYPAEWEAVRDRWWFWHIIRTASSIAATALLIMGVFVDRTPDRPVS